MSVIQVLEKYERKHKAAEDDKAGWKRLIHGAVSKAAGLLWTTGGSMDVTLGPSSSESPSHYPDSVQFTDIQSPPKDAYLSVSFDSENGEEELFLSLDETSCIKIASSNSKNCPTPKYHSTPYKKKSAEDKSTPIKKDAMEKVEIPVNEKLEGNYSKPLEEGSPSGDAVTPKKEITADKEDMHSVDPRSPHLTHLCSEMERLSLKKMIVEVEKSIAAEMKEEFDKERRKIEEHDKKVSELLTREEEEREMEEQLVEMNWFQRVRESQLQVEQDFNAKLDAILAKTKKSSSEKKLQGFNSKCDESQKDSELELVAKKRALIESIGETQKSYNSKYNDILHLLQSCRVALVSEFQSDFDTLKRNNTRLTDVISKSRCGNVEQSDAIECNRLLNFLVDLFNKINARIEEYENTKKLEEEANAKLIEAMKKNEENAKLLTIEKLDTSNKEEMDKQEISIEVLSECSKRRLDRLKYYKYVSKLLKKAEESLEPFLNDDKYKNFRKDCQRAVNVPVNAISPTSSHHLIDKLDKLTDLLDGRRVPVMSRKFDATIHPMGIKYCQVLLARKIVKAGEDVVSSHPETGHAIASVVQALTVKYPILTVYLHAFFFRVCPYLVPLDLKPQHNEPDQHYNKRLGFTYENDEREETDKFLKRMSGVAQLYAAISVAHKRRGDFGVYSPLGISDLWVWLTNFISIEPLSDVSATILLDMLEVSGHFMLTCYGFNFQKLLYLICTDYLEKINKVTTKGRGGPVERLKTFLEDVIKVKRIPPPKGLLPPQFW